MESIFPLKEGVYRLIQGLASARTQRRHSRDFDGVERFCLFVGYPRSGHSIVGAMLNAHRNAVISHELVIPPLVLGGCSRNELYARILARAWWFHMRGDRANYSYAIPGEWQGRFESLRVIGDKRGGAVSRALLEHPDFLSRLRSLVGVPLKLVHVVRNPFDNIAAISIGHEMSLQESIEFYFHHCQATSRLDSLCGPDEVVTAPHEEMVRDPAAFLSALCGFLGLPVDPGHIANCSRVVFRKPTYTRRKILWSTAAIREVESRVRTIPFLRDYEYEIRADEQTGGIASGGEQSG